MGGQQMARLALQSCVVDGRTKLEGLKTKGILPVFLFGFELGLDCLISGFDCLISGLDCLSFGLGCLISGLDCLISGLDCLVYECDCLISGLYCLISGRDCFVWWQTKLEGLKTKSMLPWRNNERRQRGEAVRPPTSYLLPPTSYLLPPPPIP